MSIERFDGAEVWRTLTPTQQAEVGALALELVAMWHFEDKTLDLVGERVLAVMRVYAAHGDTGIIDRLQEAFVESVPREWLIASDGTPKVPASLGRICRHCGCSDGDTCGTRCSWVEHDLCSACVGAAA